MENQTIPNQPVQSQTNPTVYIYADIWWRLAAWLVDNAIFISAFFVVNFLTLGLTVGLNFNHFKELANSNPSTLYSFSLPLIIFNILLVIARIAYGTWFESSKMQGTIGKIVVGLKVTDGNGYRLTTSRAIFRNIVKHFPDWVTYFNYILIALMPIFNAFNVFSILSFIYLFTCLVTMIFSQKKQALHDMAAFTVVVRKL